MAASNPSADAAAHATTWKVYAVRYATIPGFPVHDLVAGADTTRTLDLAMMFWLLDGPDHRHVLVDAGFYRQKFLDAWKPADYRRPSSALEQFGLSPDSVTDVIISHVHWDHLDGTDLYLYENLEQHRPIAQTLDAASNLAAQDRMKYLASSQRWIVPGHDPAVFKRFRAVATGMVAIP